MTNWSLDDSSVAPATRRSGLYTTEAQARSAINEWSGGLTKNSPSEETKQGKMWYVRREAELFGFGVFAREVHSEHAARKAGQRAHQKGESTPQSEESANAGSNSESVVSAGSESSDVAPTDPTQCGPVEP